LYFKKFLTIEHVIIITDFCSCIYVFGCKLSLVILCDSDFGITPVDDITIGITCAAFCFHLAHNSFASSWYLFCLSVIVLERLLLLLLLLLQTSKPLYSFFGRIMSFNYATKLEQCNSELFVRERVYETLHVLCTSSHRYLSRILSGCNLQPVELHCRMYGARPSSGIVTIEINYSIENYGYVLN
jgi:hypothetical protein